MRFHFPSFVFGVAVGASGMAIRERLRPLALEVATSVYRLGDAIVLRAAQAREDVEDLLAEARARARAYAAFRPGRRVEAQA